MRRINIDKFISELDSFFAHENLKEAENCLIKWKNLATDGEDLSGELSVLNEMVGYYRQTGNKEKGMEAISRSLELVALLSIESEISGGTIFLNCATTMKSFGLSLESIDLYTQAENVLSEKLNSFDPLLAGLYNNMALALQDLKKYNDSENYFLKALNITEKDEKNALETAISYVNLAHLYFDQDPIDNRVNTLIEKSLEILKNPSYYGYNKYAYTCRKCAPSYGYFGYFLDEKDINERADKAYARA